MNVSEPCPICNTISHCECKQGILKFFSILQSASERVLSNKPASKLNDPDFKSAGIDKLNGYFLEPIPIRLVREMARENALPMRTKYLRDKKEYLEVGHAPKVMHFRISHDKSQIVGFSTNPNRFESWIQFIGAFYAVTPPSAVEQARPTRIDLNLDFRISFNELLMSLDFELKRDSLSFIDSSGTRTGVVIGKGSESILIYDKAHKEKANSPWSRIEIRLSGAKLPSRTIAGIPSAISSGKPFLKVHGLTVTPDHHNNSHKNIIQFYDQFKRDGFFATKKTLNRTRNIHRDILRHLKIKPWAQQPANLFKSAINQFLNPIQENNHVDRRQTNINESH